MAIRWKWAGAIAHTAFYSQPRGTTAWSAKTQFVFGTTALRWTPPSSTQRPTAKYPTASFKSTKVIFDGDKPSAIEGDLTVKDVTKPVTLKVASYVNTLHSMLKRDAIDADASTVIKHSDFHAGKYAPNVDDDVTISIAIEAIKQ